MISNEQKSKIKEIYEKLGTKNQMYVCIEELSELIKEIIKFLRGKGNKNNVLEELTDVYIVLEYIQLLLQVEKSDIQEIAKFKIDRTLRRITNGEETTKRS